MKAGTFYVVEDEQIVELTGKNRLTIKNTGKNPILIDSKKITASSYPITKTETFEVEINKLYMKSTGGLCVVHLLLTPIKNSKDA